MSSSVGRGAAGNDWGHLPEAPAKRSWRSALAAWLIAAVPMCAQLTRLGHGEQSIVRACALTLGASLLVVARPRWMKWVAPLTVVLLLADRTVPASVLLLFVLLIASWLLVMRAVPVRHDPVSESGRVLGVPWLIAASIWLMASTGVQGPATLVLIGDAGLAVGSWRPEWFSSVLAPARGPLNASRRAGAGIMNALESAGRVLGAVIGSLVMMFAAIIIGLTNVAQRVVRFDPLAPPTFRWTRWVGRNAWDVTPARAFATTATWDPRGARRSVHRGLAGLLALCLLAGCTLAGGVVVGRVDLPSMSSIAPPGTDSNDATGCEGAEPHPVIADQPHAAELDCELLRFVSRPLFNAETVFEYPDRTGRFVNVRDGKRSTWQAPPCDCRRVRLWWFGGSAAWGWLQRDDYTIPSEIVKEAHRRGLTVDVTNYAMPAWVLGQEALRFERLLESEEAPDMAVFYDGGNELNRQKERNGRGLGADESATSFLEAELTDYLWNGPPPAGVESWDRPGPYPGSPLLPPEAVAQHAVNRYGRDVQRVRVNADAAGAEAVFLWQPLMHAAPAVASETATIPEIDDPIWSRMVPEARQVLPAGVEDLSDVLDGIGEPVFQDFYHHNEAAARVVAAAIVDRLEPQIRSIVESSAPS